MARISKQVQDQVKLFNENDTRVMRVGYQREYLTLYIDDQVITQGESEVTSRVKQINREQGYTYFEV
jgi:hypothetical protein